MEPFRPHLFPFHRLAMPFFDSKNIYFYDVAGLFLKFKIECRHFFHALYSDAGLLGHFSHSRLFHSFTRLKLAAKAIPSTDPKTSLLHTEEDSVVVMDESEG